MGVPTITNTASKALIAGLTSLLLSSPPSVVAQEPIIPPKARSYEDRQWYDLEATKRVPPTYPQRAARKGQDGWVHIRHKLADNGDVVDPVVVQSYPPGVFDKSALRAVEKWQYAKPVGAEGGGFPEYAQIVITYELEGRAGVRPSVGKKLKKTNKDIIEDKDYDTALTNLNELSLKGRDDWLSMYELAAIEQTRALLAYATGNYEDAIDHGERTLRLGNTLDKPNIIATHRILFSAYFGDRRFREAVRMYDKWLDLDPTAAESSISETIEQIRTILDSGQEIVIE